MDADYRILAANAAYRRTYGGGRDVVGQTCYAVSHGTSLPVRRVRRILSAGGQPGQTANRIGCCICITRRAATSMSMWN